MMNAINDPLVEDIIKDPGRLYTRPGDVLRDPDLSAQDKKIILDSWEQDQLALLNAEDENMHESASAETENAAKLVQDIEKAKKRLDVR